MLSIGYMDELDFGQRTSPEFYLRYPISESDIWYGANCLLERANQDDTWVEYLDRDKCHGNIVLRYHIWRDCDDVSHIKVDLYHYSHEYDEAGEQQLKQFGRVRHLLK